jgi:hypothetical protein
MDAELKPRDPRKSLRQPGWITFEGGFATRQCIVEDLSATGAKVTTEQPIVLPASFRLAFARDARKGAQLRRRLAPRPDGWRQIRPVASTAQRR